MKRNVIITKITALAMLTFQAGAATLVGFSFSASDLIPETLDSHLTVQNQTVVGSSNLSNPGLLLIYDSGDDMYFEFDVLVESGYEMDITGLFVGQERQWKSNNDSSRPASLNVDDGSGLTEITSTVHTPPDRDLGAGVADFTDNTLSLSGLTGTVTFRYAGTPKPADNDRLYFEDLNLIGTVTATAIPELSSVMLFLLFGAAAAMIRKIL